MREIILDTETTGLDVNNGDCIVELAALEMIDKKLTGNFLHLYFNPTKMIDISAQNVHGISIFDLIKAPELNKDACLQIGEFIKNADLVIHNAKFDMKFLDFHFKQNNLNIADFYNNVIDTLIIARERFPNMRNSLDALTERFNITDIDRTFHGALVDCQILSKVYIELMNYNGVVTNKPQKNKDIEKIIFSDLK